MRREERVTVQGPVKKQQPDGMSHGGGGRWGPRKAPAPPAQHAGKLFSPRYGAAHGRVHEPTPDFTALFGLKTLSKNPPLVTRRSTGSPKRGQRGGHWTCVVLVTGGSGLGMDAGRGFAAGGARGALSCTNERL